MPTRRDFALTALAGAAAPAAPKKALEPLPPGIKISLQVPTNPSDDDLVFAKQLGVEWEWENSPEVSLVVVDDVADASELFNRLSPRFGISLISDDDNEQADFWPAVDAPFVGDGFTRWVDGQFALDKPELGLSNWQHGRLFARSGVLSGDSAYTVRLRVRQTDADLHR